MRDTRNAVYVSAASTWEIAIKAALGKLRADLHAVAAAARATGFEELAVSVPHTLRVQGLARHHRDPFDRMLVAQALEEGLTIVTHDPSFASYQVPTLWT